MCCLIAALFDPSCTPGDVCLVLTPLLHAKKHEYFLTCRDFGKGKDKDYNDRKNRNNVDGLLVSHFPELQTQRSPCPREHRRGRCRLLSCHYTGWF